MCILSSQPANLIYITNQTTTAHTTSALVCHFCRCIVQRKAHACINTRPSRKSPLLQSAYRMRHACGVDIAVGIEQVAHSTLPKSTNMQPGSHRAQYIAVLHAYGLLPTRINGTHSIIACQGMHIIEYTHMRQRQTHICICLNSQSVCVIGTFQTAFHVPHVCRRRIKCTHTT